MNKTKHTPGPISIDVVHMRQTDEILLCRDAGGTGNGELVAKVYGDYSFALKAAAAPEMFEALKGVVKSINSDDWFEKVQAAIAKAEGQNVE